MRRFLSCLLLTAVLFSLCPQASSDNTGEAKAPAMEGSLFLKVSSITFSYVGESDDRYCADNGCLYSNCLGPFLAESYGEVVLIDLRYDRQSVSELVRQEGFDDILVCYSCANFLTDTNLTLLR